ncbi:hypothetical protein RDI58_027019 [Solanum bulbocastanum]|uniref:Uncharacterized protein n=1 Tax=Solanum bulbocastanum TaxID=147425 RepID=A0AAN8T1H0_SOLBU
MGDVPKCVLILALNFDLENEMALVGGLGGIKDSLTRPLKLRYLHYRGESESIDEDNPENILNHTTDNNVDNTNDEKEEEFHEVENEIFEEPNGINIRNDQNDSIEEEQLGQQQQEENINSLVDTCECIDRLSPVEAEFN